MLPAVERRISADAFPNTTQAYQMICRHSDALKDSVLAQFFLR